MQTYQKDPDDVVDYSIDYAAAIGTDTITSSEWNVELADAPVRGSRISTGDGALRVLSDSLMGTTASVFVGTGRVDANYLLRNTITTSGGRSFRRSLRIEIRNL